MSKIKKVLAVFLTLAMVLGMGVTTFAAEGNDGVVGTSDDTGIITVKGIEETVTSVTAYPIVTAEYDANNNFSGYSNPYNLVDITSPTQSELAAIAADTLPNDSYPLTLSGKDYTAEVPVGMYLIIVKGSTATVYNEVVASVYYANENGNVIKDGKVEVTDTITEGNAWVKKTDEPTIEKTIADDENGKGNSANIGDTINYNVSISPVPNYGGLYPRLNVVDTLSAGLTYAGNLKVDVVENNKVIKTLEDTKDYSFFLKGQEITVDFVVNGGYTLNDYVGKEIVISYSAKLNENAALNEKDNNNNVVLDFTRDSNTDGNTGKKEDKTYTYTFDIDGSATGTDKILTKIGEDTDSKALEGAEFTLYKDAECKNVYQNFDKDGNVLFDGVALSDKAGQIYMKGLAAGTYYLKETNAPDGYSINTHVFEVKIAATFDTISGKLASWTITIDGKVTSTFNVANDGSVTIDKNETTIKNTKLSSLPSTGGIGTTIFTIGGCLIMIIAAALFFASRRKNNK